MPQQYIILFAFGAMLFWGVGDFLLQKMSKKLGSIYALTWIYFVGSLVLLPWAVNSFYLIKTPSNFITLFSLGIIECAYGIFVLKAFERGKLSVVDVLFLLELPLTVILGMVFLGEKVDLLQMILIACIIFGAILISRKKLTWLAKLWSYLTGSNKILEKGALLALGAGTISGFYNLMVAVSSRNVSPVLTIWFAWTISCIFLVIYLWHKKNLGNFFRASKNNKNLILAGSVLDVLAWLFFATALSQKDLSITTAITESYPAIAIFLGIRFNKEKISKWQLIGAAVALGASIAISLIS